MVEIPKINLTIDAIDKEMARRAGEQSPRTYLGASQIGEACSRKLWYDYRQVKKSNFNGRMLRLFERGQREESFFIKLLHSIGIQVWDKDEKTGKQFRVQFGPHFGGSCDGVGLGILESPKTPHLLEFKTSNDRRFKELCSKGVKIAEFKHYAQMQIYMLGLNLERAFYLSVNKNDDTLYQERIYFDKKIAEGLVEKAHRIIMSKTPMPKINENPGWYECKYCDYSSICHHGEKVDRNCRTCHWSAPDAESEKWVCSMHEKDAYKICSEWEQFKEWGED